MVRVEDFIGRAYLVDCIIVHHELHHDCIIVHHHFAHGNCAANRDPKN